MKIAIMQSQFLRYVGYYRLGNAVHFFVFYNDVLYIRRRWASRNSLVNRGRPGLWQCVSVPVRRTTGDSKIPDIGISGECQ